jgi:membrane-bound ClpP family serine protease
MKLLHSCSIAAAALGLLASASVVAGDTKSHPGNAVPASAEAEVQMMDTNKDGKVSPNEHAIGAKAMFDAMDTDKNAVVTAAEMDGAQKAAGATGKAKSTAGKMSSGEKIKVVDKDGDGKLSAAEHSAGAESMFTKMDQDADGFLTAAEIDAGHKLMLSSK